AAVGARSFGLEPVEESQTHAFGVLKRLRLGERRAVEDRFVAVIVAGPVDHADVARVDAGEERVVDQPSIGPQPAPGAGRLLHHRVVEPARCLAVDLAAVDVDAQGIRLAVAVVLVTLGPRDRVVGAGARLLDHERVREALNAVRFWLEWLSVRVARRSLRFRTDRILGAGEGQEIAELGGVDHHTRAHARPPTLVEVDGEHGLHTIAARLDADGFRPEPHPKTPILSRTPA